MDNVRSMMADGAGKPYLSFSSLAEAVAKGGVVILEGDEGGQIYLTCPAALVKCGEDGLHRVLMYLDERAWDDRSSAHIYYEKLDEGGGVAGGMGGGLVTEDVWIHPNLMNKGLMPAVRAFIRGESEDLT